DLGQHHGRRPPGFLFLPAQGPASRAVSSGHGAVGQHVWRWVARHAGPAFSEEGRTAMSRSVLHVEGLTVALPQGADRPRALSNVSLEVPQGQVVCLVGESGSGKSIVAHTVM